MMDPDFFYRLVAKTQLLTTISALLMTPARRYKTASLSGSDPQPDSYFFELSLSSLGSVLDKWCMNPWFQMSFKGIAIPQATSCPTG